MPVAVVVGGQWGSEGKGKVANYLAARTADPIVVRVGGPNAGHHAFVNGVEEAYRQLPGCAPREDVTIVLPPGAIIRPSVLLEEVERSKSSARLWIDPEATIVQDDHLDSEAMSKNLHDIASTLSGSGAALVDRLSRKSLVTANDIPELAPFLLPTDDLLRTALSAGRRVILEGSQGFGLSPLHGRSWPYATSRDTTAASALGEAGLSPLDVDDVWLVLRAFPIRVGGPSGGLPRETSWAAIAEKYGHDHDLTELTTVTRRVRRVAEFTPDIVRRAIAANRPSRIALNHVDFVDHRVCSTFEPSSEALQFVEAVEGHIGQKLDFIGISPSTLLERPAMKFAHRD